MKKFRVGMMVVFVAFSAFAELIFDGEPKVLVVNGYSTSFKWPEILQAKMDRQTGGKRIVEVRLAVKGGTPIAKWMDVRTGERLGPWKSILSPVLKDSQNRPVIVLAQQSLQWVWTERKVGIADENDREKIIEGADALEKYAAALMNDGARAVFIAMHIYKEPMEPEIGNERLALAEVLKRKIEQLYSGPDVWTPMKARYPTAFALDKMHPNELGAEIMAQKWFETLLQHDGLSVPDWAVRQTAQVMARGPAPGAANPAPNNPAVFKKYDTDGDGWLSEEESAAYVKARRAQKKSKK